MRKAIIPLVIILVFVLGTSLMSCKKKEGKKEGETTITTETETTKIATVTTGPLNLRSQPTLGGQVVTVLQKGDQMQILEESPNMETIDNITAYWYLVRTAGGEEGWAFGGYLSIGTGTMETITTTTTAPTETEISEGSLPPTDISGVPDNLSYKECYNQGKSYAQAGDYNSAVAYFTRACQLNDGYGPAYFELGLAYQELGNNKDAVSAYERAISLMPNDFWAHNNLGLAYIRIGDPAKAVVVLEKALTLEPAGCPTPEAKEKAYNIARSNLSSAQKMM